MASVSGIVDIPLPPKCSELNPVENIWQYMRDNWFSNSNPTTISSIIAAMPGIRSSTLVGKSCPSGYANGRTSSVQ
jgi:transposase